MTLAERAEALLAEADGYLAQHRSGLSAMPEMQDLVKQVYGMDDTPSADLISRLAAALWESETERAVERKARQEAGNRATELYAHLEWTLGALEAVVAGRPRRDVDEVIVGAKRVLAAALSPQKTAPEARDDL